MIIEINKDIEKYKESVVLGLTAKQLLCSVASVLVGGCVVLLLYKHIGLTGSAYIAVPIVAPIAMNGFYSNNGMSFMEVCRRRITFLFANKPLFYVSTEGEKLVSRQNSSVESADEVKGAFKERSSLKRQMRRKLIILAVFILAAIVVIAGYKAGLFAGLTK